MSTAVAGAARAPRGRDANRFELKYVVPEPVARALRADLEGRVRPDEHGGPDGYTVHSVYWDSADLVFFWEKLDGEKLRRKLRFRRYGAEQAVFVEIKQRDDRTVQKRRARIGLAELGALFGPGGSIDPRAEHEVEGRVLSEALFLCRYHALAPTMAVRYRREALVAPHEHDLRITFDRELRLDAHALDPTRPQGGGRAILDPRLVVVELKFCHAAPLWLAKLVRRHELSLTRISKYCAAVDRAFFGGRYT